MTNKVADKVKQVFDSDGSGEVSYEEFSKFCETSDIENAVKVISEALKLKKKKEKLAKANRKEQTKTTETNGDE